MEQNRFENRIMSYGIVDGEEELQDFIVGAEKTADYLIAKHEEIVRKEKAKTEASKPTATRRKSTKKLFA